MRKTLACLAIFCIFAITPAAVVLNESFDSDAGYWNPLYSGAYTISGGNMSIACNNSGGLNWILANNSGVILSNFTLTVETEMVNPDTNGKLGIVFRTKDNFDSYHFYIYPAGYYSILKFTADSGGRWTDLNGGKLVGNSFIAPSKNNIKIVVEGDKFSFLCNGQLLTTITDTCTALCAGKVGLIVSGKMTGLFDNLVVDDVPVADNGLKSFQETFDDTTLFGWKNYAGVGSFRSLNQKLRCTSENSSNFSTIISDGRYGPEDTLSVRMGKVSVPASGGYMYGMLYHYSTLLDSNTLITQGYVFCIVNSQSFTVLKMGNPVTQLFALTNSGSIQQNIGSSNDLKVICGLGGKMDLYINGTPVKSIVDASFPSGGVGLLANSGAVIDFDNFNLTQNMIMVEDGAKYRRAPAQVNLTATPNPFNQRTRLTVGGVSGTPVKLALFDAGGSRLAKWEGKAPYAIDWNAETLPPGIYFARAVTGGHTLTQRMVLIK